MIIYTQTPDYYQEYLEHGWLKDQAAKVHKYLERWRGKNGKWYYRYNNAKASAQNALNTIKKEGKYLATKYKNKITKNPKYINAKTKYNRYRKYKDIGETFENRTDGVLAGRGKKDNASAITTNFGTKETGHWDNGTANRAAWRNANPTIEGIESGRQRRAKKAEEQRKERERAASSAIYEDNRRGYKRTSELKSKGYKQGNLSKKGYSNSTSGDDSSAIKKSKIVANQKQKAADKRGYDTTRTDSYKSYQKKPSLGTRGYISSRPLESYAYDANETKHLSRLNILDKGGFAIGSGKPEKVKESYRSPVNQDIHNRELSNLSTRSAVTNLRTPEKTRRRTKTRSRKRNL